MMTLLTIGRRLKELLVRGRGEPTITEMLSDSIVKAVMEADGVDPRELEAQLRTVARHLPASVR